MADFIQAVSVLIVPVLPAVLGISAGLAFVSFIITAVSGAGERRP